jgi:predicted HTH domain antitoxin
MSLQLTIDYPVNFPDALGYSQAEFEQQAKWAMAVKLFELGQLSSGMAAALLQVDRVTFLLKLNDYGVAMIDLSEDELLQDLENEPFVGMWADNPEMQDSTAWVKKVRQQHW